MKLSVNNEWFSFGDAPKMGWFWNVLTVFGNEGLLLLVAGVTGLWRWAVLGQIKGSIFDVVAGECWVLDGLGLMVGNFMGNGILASLAFIRYFCSARATVTCSCSSLWVFSNGVSDCIATGKNKKKAQKILSVGCHCK